MIKRTTYLAFAVQDLSTMGLKEGERVDCTRCGLRALFIAANQREAREEVAEWIRLHVCDYDGKGAPWPG